MSDFKVEDTARRIVEWDRRSDPDRVFWLDREGQIRDAYPNNPHQGVPVPARYAPDLYEDANAEIHDLGDWRLLSGWSAQDGYRGPVMHPSELVGLRLAKFIAEDQRDRYRDEDGTSEYDSDPRTFWAFVTVTGEVENSAGEVETEPVGWAIAYYETPPEPTSAPPQA